MNKIDPICGMVGRIAAHGEWFCSEYCVRKYEQEKKIVPIAKNRGQSLKGLSPIFYFYKSKLFITASVVSILLLSSFYLPILSKFRHHFFEYVGLVWKALALGFFLGGLIEVYIPRSYISKHLAKKSWTSILKATVLGFIFSGCSHGCLAITFELFKKGASIPAVIAFLLASPWANFSITVLLFSLFKWKALWIIGTSLFISLLVGFFYLWLEKKNWIEKNPNTIPLEQDFSIWQDLRNRWGRYQFSLKELFLGQIPSILKGAWHLAEMVLWWVLIGITIASLLGSLIPSQIFQEWLGKDIQGLFLTLGLATVIEVCSEGSAPLAFEIYRQSGAFGNAFIFLMAGVITDYTEIGLLWSNIGRRTALWLPALSVPIALLIGWFLNKI